jgi:hypothetical protein
MGDDYNQITFKSIAIHLDNSVMENNSQTQVAHAYNPSYSGGRDQEDHSPRQIVRETLS